MLLVAAVLLRALVGFFLLISHPAQGNNFFNECERAVRLYLHPIRYVPTNRSLEDFRKEAPKYLLSIEEMRGKKILDLAGGGEGRLVKDLRQHEIDAYGVDLLTDSPNDREYLFKGDAKKLPFKDNDFDLIYNAWSMFDALYMGRETSRDLVQILNEIHRVLRPGGRVRIMGLQFNYFRFRLLLLTVRGLKVRSHASGGLGMGVMVELEKNHN